MSDYDYTLFVNQQLSKSVGKLVLALVVNPQFSKFVGES